MMVGTMQLSRAFTDKQLSKAVLETGIESALAMIAATQRT